MTRTQRSLPSIFIGIAGLLISQAACGGESLSPAIRKVVNEPRFKHAHWGILVVDRATGEVVYEHNSDKLFAPASTTKLYSVASALEHLGAGYRFRTPVYRRGDIVGGVLRGDLILVASGDLTMGGRTDERGEIAFTDADHTYANGSRTTQLTSPDPLAGLDQIARQVANAGIEEITGEVVVDARLFETASSSGSGPSKVTPILINDNLVDITVTPGSNGELAQIDWRPRAPCYDVKSHIQTVAAEDRASIEIRETEGGRLELHGQIPVDHPPIIRVYEVPDPQNWARSLLIDALRRADIEVAADPLQPNASDKLPDASEYEHLDRVAELESPPFSENARLILKVSHNLHASTLPLLVAARHGKRKLNDGLQMQHDFLKRAGVEVESISFGGAAGGANSDFTTPRANVELLRYMTTRPDFDVYFRALPVLGVDGTLHEAVASDSPAVGKAQAKTGTLYWYNGMNDSYLLTSKALAGYMTGKSGRELVFSFVVSGVHLDEIEQRSEIGKKLGQLCEIVYVEQ
jgi:D-alanyl-D-alanine carboxypeptidase/D-alanyl-D-alanine-endopeptidase (penicillin-binding protein 4)